MKENIQPFFPMPGLQVAEERFKKLLKASSNSDHILIRGPRGSGKSYFLEVFHKYSQNISSNVVRRNCAAIPDKLADSEIFGYMKGAFTGADKDTEGFIHDAKEQKVIILEEFNSLPKEIQAKLLLYIETSEFYRVGAREPESVEARIVATMNYENTTNADTGINDDHKAKNLRLDIEDRFKIMIDVPPLHLRREDIFYYIGLKYPDLVLSGGALLSLYSLPWEGNLRELDRVLFEYSAGDLMAMQSLAFPGWCSKVREILINASSEEQFGEANAYCFGGLLNWPKVKIKLSQNPVKKCYLSVSMEDGSAGSIFYSDKYFQSQVVICGADPDEHMSMDVSVVSNMFKIFFGRNSVYSSEPIDKIEPFNNDAKQYIKLLQEKSTSIANGSAPMGMDLFNVSRDILHKFLETCMQVCSSLSREKIPGEINAPLVADYLLGEKGRFFEVLRDILNRPGGGWDAQIFRKMEIPKSTLTRWKQKYLSID